MLFFLGGESFFFFADFKKFQYVGRVDLWPFFMGNGKLDVFFRLSRRISNPLHSSRDVGIM